MLTEFVENSFDAIKKEKVHNAIPEALKKMNVEFLNVRYDDNKKLAVIDVKKNKLV